MTQPRAVRMVEFGKLLVTRERGRAISRQFPKRRQLLLDFDGVDVASPSFLDETIRGAFAQGVTSLTFMNTSKSTEQNLRRILSVRPHAEDDGAQTNTDFPTVELVS